MTWQPDRAVLISLARRQDRRAQMNAMTNRLGFPIDTVDAVDGLRVDVPAFWRSSPGAYGNAQSHRDILTTQASGSLLILEDDAFIPGDFRARLETVLTKADDWDVIMLGGEHLSPPIPHSEGVVRCAAVARTIGYIVRGRAIPAAIGAIDRSREHWDVEWIKMQNVLRTYAPNPFAIKPFKSPSDIPDSTPYR